MLGRASGSGTGFAAAVCADEAWPTAAEAAKKPTPAAQVSEGFGQASSARTAAANAVPLPEARPNIKPRRQARRVRYISRYRRVR